LKRKINVHDLILMHVLQSLSVHTDKSSMLLFLDVARMHQQARGRPLDASKLYMGANNSLSW
jgi:DNA polymerase III psi subunit